MKFYSIQDKKPQEGQECLIKWRHQDKNCYYVVEYIPLKSRFYEYDRKSYWEESDIDGWLPLTDLDEIPTVTQQEEEQRKLAEQRAAFKLAFANYCQRRAFFDLD